MPQINWPDNALSTITAVVDVLAVAILLYNLILMLRGRRAMHVMTGLSILVLVYLGAVALKLDLLRTVLAALAPYTAIALIVMFQSEIRSTLAKLGRVRWLGISSRMNRREVVDEIILAIEQMADDRTVKTGALIVLEGDLGLRTFIESGVALDAMVSRDLLCVIFRTGGELHDGAVIIQGDRMAAAACFLPLHVQPVNAVRKLGTRHRAAIGVTEESDALAVVLSEETGHISIAENGELEFDVSLERLRERLTQHATGMRRAPQRPPQPELRQVAP